MATSVAQLKTYFESGDHPTQAEFWELLEAYVHRDDDLTLVLGQMAEINEAQQGLVTDKYMSPLLVFQAIKALTRLVNIPELQNEVNQSATNIVNTAIDNLLTFNDADSVINTVKDVIDAFNAMPEGQTLIALLQGKSDVGHTHTPSQVGLSNAVTHYRHNSNSSPNPALFNRGDIIFVGTPSINSVAINTGTTWIYLN